MSATTRATLLFYAALLFVVLTTISMRVYSGGSNVDPAASGYEFWNNFLSDLGATRSWSGRANTASMLLFASGLALIGAALVVFSTAWHTFAFELARARAVGVTSRVFGTLSGCSFVALAMSPVDRVLDLHNSLVVIAFVLLLGYAVALTLVWWRNGATRHELGACSAYVVIVLLYFAVVIYAARLGIGTARGRELLIGSQKVMAYASMAYVMYFTVVVRRRLRAT